MKKQISTLVGIVIILGAAVVAFGGVFTYEHFMTKAQPTIQIQQIQNTIQNQKAPQMPQQLSDAAIIGAINKLDEIQLQRNTQNGLYTATSIQGDYTYTIRSITKGDLSGDGFQDALVLGSIVSGSGGSSDFIIVTNNGSSVNAFSVNPDGINVAGAGQYDIKNVGINNRIITISVDTTNPDGSVGPNLIFNYKLVGNNLVRAN